MRTLSPFFLQEETPGIVANIDVRSCGHKINGIQVGIIPTLVLLFPARFGGSIGRDGLASSGWIMRSEDIVRVTSIELAQRCEEPEPMVMVVNTGGNVGELE
jgi:hypothetical protein